MLHESTGALNELAEALDVSPSPEFAAKVRGQIEQERRAPWRARWLAAVALVSVAGLAAWIGIASRPQEQTQGVAQPAVAGHFVQPALPSIPSGGDAREAPGLVKPAVRRVARPAARAAEPEVLVSPDQRLALDQLKAVLEDGRLDPSVLPQNLVDASTQMPLPSPSQTDDKSASPTVFQKLEKPVRYVGYRAVAD